MTALVHLKAGKEKSLKRLHPWLFSGAIARVKGTPKLGETVAVHADNGDWLGWAAWSPHSQIRARIWSFKQSEAIDADFFMARLRAAKQFRDGLIQGGALKSNAYRLCAAEADGLPGITIDKYDQWLVLQLLSAGAEAWRDTIVDCLQQLFPDCHLYERSDVDVRKKEGLEQVTGPLSGVELPQQVVIEENGLQLGIDIGLGHKTGYYLDQRDSRQAITKYCHGKSVLNAFSYTGGFGVYAAAAGATEVVNVDVSDAALQQADKNLALNPATDTQVEHLKADVFQALRDFHHQGRRFDVIVLDPPKFVDSKANLMSACRGYKDINRMAAMILKPGGILMTFSCSGLLSAELFQKVVADAALDAKRPLQIIEHLYQAPDHPVLLSVPEGLYLKGLVLQAAHAS